MLYGFDGFAMIGTQEIMIIAGVAVLLFGGSKIPELMRGMGQGIKEFKNAASEAATVNTPSPASGTNVNTALEVK